MIIILSSQFVGESLALELGNLPLSFIPLANRRLYYHQVEALRRAFPAESIQMTLPSNYILNKVETEWFKNNSVLITKIKHHSSTGEELRAVLSKYLTVNEPLRLLLGSCLPTTFPTCNDVIATVDTDLELSQPVEKFGGTSDIFWSGYISVSDVKFLWDCLREESWNYVRAVKRYSFARTLYNQVLDRCFVLDNAASYFHTRSRYTTERAFNRLIVKNNVLTKYGDDESKLVAEAAWYENLPRMLRRYCPQYFGESTNGDKYSYSIEYLPSIAMSELFVYGRKTVVFWRRFFGKVALFFEECRLLKVEEVGVSAGNSALFKSKTRSRMLQFEEQMGFDINKRYIFNGVETKSLTEIYEESSVVLDLIPDVPALIHGDLCLSNILYDSKGQSFKILDPRGLDANGKEMSVGSQVYDLAKLAHSIIGLYDHIVSEQYLLEFSGDEINFQIYLAQDVPEIQDAFIQTFFPGEQERHVIRILPLLFISMLPLHYDSKIRQRALLANVFRLSLTSANALG